jgi:uncharacterized protein YbaP (TraB family)
MLGILIAASLAATSPPTLTEVAPEPANADPAIFVVRDPDTVIYIFGTFHALDGKSEWFNDQVKDAFEDSDELVLETLIPERPAQPGTYAIPSRQLRAVAPSASFLASTRMAINAGKSRGMQVTNGADMVLRHAAEAEGKPVEGLETLESQIDMFAKLSAPKAAQAGPQRPGPAPQMPNLSRSMVDMQSAWKRGDQAVFVKMLSQLEQGSPDTYRMMFTERNARWADWIRARMQTPGTVFVAVGAGHLAGKDSVLARLGDLGVYSTRVN